MMTILFDMIFSKDDEGDKDEFMVWRNDLYDAR